MAKQKQEIITKEEAEELRYEVGELLRERSDLKNGREEESNQRLHRNADMFAALLGFGLFPHYAGMGPSIPLRPPTLWHPNITVPPDPELNLYMYARNNPLRFTDPDGRRIVIDQDGANITIHTTVDLYVSPDMPSDFATFFTQAITNQWQGTFPNYADATQPDWNVTVDLDLRQRYRGRDWSRHAVRIEPVPQGNAHVNMLGGMQMQINPDQVSMTSELLMAHEFGHWLGLSDRYDLVDGMALMHNDAQAQP